MFFGQRDGANRGCQHGLAEILLQVQIEGIQQIVFSGKVAKQGPSATPALRAINDVEAAIPDCANATVAASSKACFFIFTLRTCH